MQIFPIVSSSDGNCTFIKTASVSILIDCGISLKQLRKSIGRDRLNDLDAIFITHEHFDHIKGLDTLCKKLDLPVYINLHSLKAKANQLRNINYLSLKAGDEIRISDLTVIPFNVKHDTINTFGFSIIEDSGTNLCYLTDSGIISEENKLLIAEADVLLIEFNYDEDLFRDYTGYSDNLKERIVEHHLSNRQTIDALEEIGVDTFDLIIPAHLSPRTNSPELLTAELTNHFPDSMYKFAIAPFQQPLDTEEIRRQPVEEMSIHQPTLKGKV